ncbi:type VI secretion system baseplate subunit TssG [Serratia sp. Se-PFBMAAmG]|nr:type VI secretion system baseplate subunit TssG [Serratia sp. Se-PFBMAAmG]
MDDESEESRVRHKADLITQDAHRYSYFQLLELMHQLHGDDLEQRPLSDEARRRLRLEVSPSLSFPVADVLSASRLKDDRYCIQASFLGLHGTDSPLPGYYLDQLAYEHAQDIGVRPAFRDLLPSGDNYHRLVKLVDFLLRDVGAYDLELRMRAEEAPPFSLRAEHGTHLGWTSFIADRNDTTPPPVRIMVRA